MAENMVVRTSTVTVLALVLALVAASSTEVSARSLHGMLRRFAFCRGK